MLHSDEGRRLGRRENGFFFEISDVALTFNRHWRVMSRERHHCASADVERIVSHACVYRTIVIGVVLASWPLKTKPEAEFRLMFPVSADRPPQPGDTSVSSEPAGGYVVAGNRLDAGKTQLRRRSVSPRRELRRRDVRRHALFGGRWCQWYCADNTCKIMTITSQEFLFLYLSLQKLKISTHKKTL